MSMNLEEIFDCDWDTEICNLTFTDDHIGMDVVQTLPEIAIVTTHPPVEPSSTHFFPLLANTASADATAPHKCWDDQSHVDRLSSMGKHLSAVPASWWRGFLLLEPPPAYPAQQSSTSSSNKCSSSDSTSSTTNSTAQFPLPTTTTSTSIHPSPPTATSKTKRREGKACEYLRGASSVDFSSAMFNMIDEKNEAILKAKLSRPQFPILNTANVRPRTVSDGSSASSLSSASGSSSPKPSHTTISLQREEMEENDPLDSSFAFYIDQVEATIATMPSHHFPLVANTDIIRPRTVSDGSSASYSSGSSSSSSSGPSSPESSTDKIYVLDEDIEDNDVLFGRGARSNLHPGNGAYRQRILKKQPVYKTLNDKRKTLLSDGIVQWVKQGLRGRFLAIEKTTKGKGRYYVATDKQARQKVSQALREDHTPEGRRLKKSRQKAANRPSRMIEQSPQKVLEACLVTPKGHA